MRNPLYPLTARILDDTTRLSNVVEYPMKACALAGGIMAGYGLAKGDYALMATGAVITSMCTLVDMTRERSLFRRNTLERKASS